MACTTDEEPGESPQRGTEMLLTVSSALVLANRLRPAVNAVLTVGEDPVDGDRALAQMLARGAE